MAPEGQANAGRMTKPTACGCMDAAKINVMGLANDGAVDEGDAMTTEEDDEG